jgi:hypothetical protein
MPLNNLPISAITTPINDQSASGYTDIGTLRIQWGKASQAGSALVPVNLPAPFLNTTYVVNLSPLGTSSSMEGGQVQINSVSQFSFNGYYVLTTGVTAYNNGRQYGWFAIGLKP